MAKAMPTKAQSTKKTKNGSNVAMVADLRPGELIAKRHVVPCTQR